MAEEASRDLMIGWELGTQWALQHDALYEKLVNGQSVPLQELVEFDRLIEALTPLVQQYHGIYEKRMDWDSSGESLLEAVKNSWSLILLSSSPCRKCGEVITSSQEGATGGRMQDGALALMNDGLCEDCKKAQSQPASQSADPYGEVATRQPISEPKITEQLSPSLPPRQLLPTARMPGAIHTVGSNERVDGSAWRYTKVGLRTIWRLTTLLASATAALFMAALILLSLFMFLYEYWEGESGRGRRTAGGFESEKFFAFVNGVTWLPQQMWHGLIFLVTIVFVAAVLFGDSLWNVASSHVGVVAALVCLCGLVTVVWVSRREWRSEFLHFPKAPTTNSWVMGLIVLVAATGVLCWSYENGAFDGLKSRTESHGNQFPAADMNHQQ